MPDRNTVPGHARERSRLYAEVLQRLVPALPPHDPPIESNFAEGTTHANTEKELHHYFPS